MNYDDFQWIHESTYEELSNGIQLYAPKHSDYFVNPLDGEVTTTAPFFYKEISGDFVCRAKVSHEFLATYDACVLLALDTETTWAKACFEFSDLGTHNIVSVMTNQVSDDANGVEINGKEVWLQLARKGQLFAVHYSLDGKLFQMARLTRLRMRDTIKVGFEAQSPMGEGGMRKFTDILCKEMSLADIRNGNID